MAYGDTVDPKSRVVSIVLVGIITFLLGWLLVSGLAIEAVKKVAEKLDVVDVNEPPPPEEPPPPPPPDNKLPPPPPVVIPKPPFQPPNQTNTVRAVETPPPVAPAPVLPTAPAAPPAPPASPPPPAPEPDKSRPVAARGNPGSWVTPDDYPAGALREEKEGVTGFRLTVGADGRATDCSVTSSSGHSDLDEATCRYAPRRARFTPALDKGGNPTTAVYNGRVRWQIPKD